MNGSWPENFLASVKEANKDDSDPEGNVSNLGPLSLSFKHIILAYIIPTSLIPQKGSINNVACWDVLCYII